MSRASTLLFPSRGPTVRRQDVFDRSHWRFRMENEPGGLYGFPEDRRPEIGRAEIGVNGPANGTNPINNMHAAASSQNATQQSVLAQEDRLIPGSDISEPVTGMPFIPDYSRIWDPDNNGTIFKNGSLTVAIRGLSLEKNWCDPDNLPPWALTNHSRAQYENVTSTRVGDPPSLAPRGASLVELKDQETKKDFKAQGEKRIFVDNSKCLISPNAVKRAKVSYGQAVGCSLKLSNRGGRGTKGKGRGGRTRNSHRADTIGNPPLVVEDGELCDVVISPSKDLQDAEDRSKALGKEGFSHLQGRGGWPKIATRNS